MNEDTNVRLPASGMTIILVSGDVKFMRILEGDPLLPIEGIKVRYSPVAGENLINNRP